MTQRATDFQKRARGTARADRPGRGSGRGGGVTMPRGLASNKPAARAWRLIAAELGDRLRPVDGLALQLLALHFGAAVDAAAALAEGGLVVNDAAHVGIKKHPAAAVFTAHSDRALRFLVEFGATPRARAVSFPEDVEKGPSLIDLLFAEVGD